ncbi:MAG: TetR/AcrR family transcriptional regulator [Spirochaetota bacterium]
MTSRERIMEAAVSVFARKGKHGAHMEEIAAAAHINKAMIYYIFHSKDELYYEIIRSFIEKSSVHFSQKLQEISLSGKCGLEFIEAHISAQIDFFADNPLPSQICIEAVTTRSEDIHRAILSIQKQYAGIEDISVLLSSNIEAAKKNGVIRNIDTDQLLISITELVMTYFFSPSFAQMLDIDVSDEKAFLEKRKKALIDLVINGISVK